MAAQFREESIAASEDRSFDFNKIPPEDAARELSSNPEDLHVDPLAPPEPGLELAVREWRGAKALFRLRDQINATFPGRNKASDGLIGDAAHATRASDHNPWVIDNGVGVVTAIDITHDPMQGCDAGALARRSGKAATGASNTSPGTARSRIRNRSEPPRPGPGAPIRGRIRTIIISFVRARGEGRL
jgi:hypothetical protein